MNSVGIAEFCYWSIIRDLAYYLEEAHGQKVKENAFSREFNPT